MGLDAVELVMEFESDFDIEISDAMATEMTTIGITVQKIVELLRLKPAAASVCPTARSYYRLRSELMRRFGMPRNLVRPNVPIGMLVPPSGERGWSDIADASGLRREPNVLFKTRFPAPMTRLGELMRTRCKGVWRRVDGTIDEDAVFQHVRRIISDQLGVPIEKLHAHTRYIEDLG